MSEYLNITPYSVIYLVSVMVVFVYTIRNRLDILCVCAVCYVVYTMYCSVGYGISGFYRPHLSSRLYILVYMQIILILVFTAIMRRKNKDRYLCGNGQTDETGDAAPENLILAKSFYFYTGVIVLFALVNIVPLGIEGFAAGKANVWENTNVLYIVSLYGAYPAFAYGIHSKRKLIWIPSLLIELTIFFSGSRAFAATLIIIFLCERGVSLWKKKQNNFSVFALGACAILFLLFYRMIDIAIMGGDINSVVAAISNPTMWLEALEFNEPRVIIANYDYAITSGIQLPIGDIMYRILDFIPGVTKLIPFELQYPEYFSTWLMEQVNGSSGVGGTIWGESYVMFGGIGVLILTLAWLFLLAISNNHLAYHKPYSSFIVALGTYWAWYINRLDFNRVGQSFKVMVLCFLIWAFFYLLLGGEIQIGERLKFRFPKLKNKIVEQ